MAQNLLLSSYPSSQAEPPLKEAQPRAQATASSVRSLHSNSQTRPRKTTLPSCNLCRRRKIKCDRADPCSHCVRVGAVCVFSTPSGAPRGRQGGRRKLDSELLDRVVKLEQLLKQGTSGAASVRAESPSATAEESRNVHGMREALNQPSDEEDDGRLTPNSDSTGIAQSGQSDFVIRTADVLGDTESHVKHPSHAQAYALYLSFMTNVDPVVKLLHGPSLRRHFAGETNRLECSSGPKGWDAVKFAIYYTTTTSWTPDECLEQLGEEKAVLLHRFRSSTELALARADFVNTEDVSTLQALVLYLFAVRSNENSRRTWTMTSLAVRIAHALGLHKERFGGKYTSPYLPFEREMRRRLWWQICILDRQASIDRGTDPIITAHGFSTQLPLNVNDEDLLPNDPNEVQPREGYTDTALSLICHEVFEIERRLTYIPAGEFNRSLEMSDDFWAQRKGWVSVSQRRVEDKYLRHFNMDVPQQHYAVLLSHIIVATMWLFAYRPLQPRSDSPTSFKIPQPGILHLAVEVMDKSIQLSMHPCARPFKWMSSIWVQWYALAVMIAELCVQTEGPTVERAWSIVDPVFEETAQHVADSDKGRLWRPIKKLMTRAQEVRKKHLADVAAAFRSQSIGAAPTAAEQAIPWLITQHSDSNGMDMDAEPKPLLDNSSTLNLPQQIGTGTEPMSVDWASFFATGATDQIDYNDEINEMAWTNWASFIDDFQSHEAYLSGSDNAPPRSFNTW
ncbi:hypothetical protein GJ744_002444 [Endocarpon pusillum]|uniref:Zn(2)-C6 fungal-type domain-containing protein n=1 Tax=Endocarpon pusillum TaxID=364733 RepID=A0A8H7DYU1_9EURO|nr:hypothetical protein GJ744_002444 [Endocarpon pusillum]